MWINRPTPTIPDWSRPDLFIGEPPLLIISQPTKNCKLPMHHTKKSAHALSPIWSQCPLKATLPPKALVQHPNFSHPSHVLSIYIYISLSPTNCGPSPYTHTLHACKQMHEMHMHRPFWGERGPYRTHGLPTILSVITQPNHSLPAHFTTPTSLATSKKKKRTTKENFSNN